MVPMLEAVAGGMIDEDRFDRYHKMPFELNEKKKTRESFRSGSLNISSIKHFETI